MRFSIGIVIFVYLSVWILLAQAPLWHGYTISPREPDALEAYQPEGCVQCGNPFSEEVPGFSSSGVSIRGQETDSAVESNRTGFTA